MFRPRVIPVLLIYDGGLVKSIKFKNLRYLGDPINAVRIFNDLEVDELMILDIRATVKNSTISDLIVKEIGDEAYMPIAVGGGINKLDQVSRLINAGIEKIVFNTALISNPAVIFETSKIIGSQSVIVSIDVKKQWYGKYKTYIRSGSKSTGFSPETLAKMAEDLGAGEIMINDIDNDGMMGGYDLELIESVSSSVKVPVVACGGAGNLLDLRKGYKAGAHALAAGSLFVYQGARKGILVNYPSKSELIELFNKDYKK